MAESGNATYIKWKYQHPPAFQSFWFEQIDYDAWKQYAATNWTFSFYASVLYLVVIFSLKQVMKDRAPLKIRWALIFWNVCLGIFSTIGFLRTGQELMNVLMTPGGFHKSICSRVGLNPPAAFYSVAFALSKYVELGDTIFIILYSKQPLQFLQWYHHCSTLVLAWKVMPYSEPIFRYYGVMNYGVHAIMYPYFALKVMGIRIRREFSMIITGLQMGQFFLGVGLNVYSVHVISKHGPEACARHSVSIKWIGGIYASFLILFAHFFYERYLSKRKAILKTD
ncbi:Elongation of very long chain fatty acids protein 6 [Orchesella cincta]|uniref:Elongation of very long chain fatty acids protein n=1 Tax=Orchesella cincta TaxID=48709 RepID=A0A1D2NJX7_ORCCI|nr:Elongation of very long chain fatty acids protein 6 [Orchesella cincta]